MHAHACTANKHTHTRAHNRRVHTHTQSDDDRDYQKQNTLTRFVCAWLSARICILYSRACECCSTLYAACLPAASSVILGSLHMLDDYADTECMVGVTVFAALALRMLGVCVFGVDRNRYIQKYKHGETLLER